MILLDLHSQRSGLMYLSKNQLKLINTTVLYLGRNILPSDSLSMLSTCDRKTNKVIGNHLKGMAGFRDTGALDSLCYVEPS